MLKIAKIIKKDMKLLLRSRTSSLIVIFGPLLVMLLVGAAFNNANKYSISVSVYSDKYSELTESFLKKLSENKYSVTKSSSNATCIESVKQGSSHLCILFPADLKTSDNKQNEVTFVADYSRVNLVYMAVDTLSSNLGEESKSISLDLTQTLLTKIEDTKSTLSASLATIKATKDKNAELTAKNLELGDNSGKVSKSLDGLSGNADIVGLANNKVRDTFTLFKTDTGTRVAEIKSKLSGVKTAIDLLPNVTDDTKASLKDNVDISIGNAESIEYKLSTSVNTTDASWKEVNDLVTQLKQNIDNSRVSLAAVNANSKSIDEALTASSTKTTLLETSITGILANIGTIQVTSAEKIASPIITKIIPLLAEKTHLNYIFSGLIALVIMFIALLLSTTIVMMEKTSPSYFRNFITPTRDIVFVIATYFSTLILVLVQMIVILAVAAYFFNTLPIDNLLNIYLAVVLITTVFTLIGMLIGYVFNTQETAILASISFGSVALLLSNMILPLESMPEYIRNIAQYNPFVISESILKSTILFHADLLGVKDTVILLGVFSVILFSIIMFLQGFTKKHLLHKWLYKTKHSLSKSDGSIEKLLSRAEHALNRNSREEAFNYYMQAKDLYEKLREEKHPASQQIYNKLSVITEKLKLGYVFK